VRARTGVFAPVIAALGAGFMFFVVTNLAVFAGDLYPHTWAGLVEDFTAALPFYRNQIRRRCAFTAALFGLHAAATREYARRIATT